MAIKKQIEDAFNSFDTIADAMLKVIKRRETFVGMRITATQAQKYGFIDSGRVWFGPGKKAATRPVLTTFNDGSGLLHTPYATDQRWASHKRADNFCVFMHQCYLSSEKEADRMASYYHLGLYLSHIYSDFYDLNPAYCTSKDLNKMKFREFKGMVTVANEINDTIRIRPTQIYSYVDRVVLNVASSTMKRLKKELTYQDINDLRAHPGADCGYVKAIFVTGDYDVTDQTYSVTVHNVQEKT